MCFSIQRYIFEILALVKFNTMKGTNSSHHNNFKISHKCSDTAVNQSRFPAPQAANQFSPQDEINGNLKSTKTLHICFCQGISIDNICCSYDQIICHPFLQDSSSFRQDILTNLLLEVPNRVHICILLNYLTCLSTEISESRNFCKRNPSDEYNKYKGAPSIS